MKSAFLIAAPTSGSGKTTIARGLMALLRKKGYSVQPFKCGPDYIDTKFHEVVCGRASINLDTFMASAEHVRALFAQYGADADISIVEGMMGLFDGYDRDRGSSAEIARVLQLPVVLVVDARSAAYSMAALLSGFLNFRKDLRFAGVIYNKVGSERHFQMLRQVCDDLGVACLGYLPKSASLEQGSRYLGLDFSEQAETSLLTDLLDQHVNWQQLVGEASKLCGVVGEASKLCGSGVVGEASKLCGNTQNKEDAAKLGSFTHYTPQFVDTSQYIHITNDKLPHWHQESKTVFVTFRLADSLPQEKLQELQAFKTQWLNAHPLPWSKDTNWEYEKNVRQKTEKWLDQGHGSCILGRVDIRRIVVNALLFHHGTRYILHHCVVMPNHVHLLVTPVGDYELSKTIGSVKRFTANAINKALGTQGTIWQRLMFDHLVRNAQQYERCVNYITDNPRNLPPDTFTLLSPEVGEASKLCGVVGEASKLCGVVGEASKLCGSGVFEVRKAWKLHPLRVLIARNAESFSFLYQEVVDSLGDVSFFDPETDVPDLNGIDLLYLPGGYPEKHLDALVNNVACRKAIKDYAERGGRIHAECGGMMYLCRSIVGEASKLCNVGELLQSLEASPTTPQSLEASPTTEYPMCGVLPYTITARKADRKLSLGYRQFTLDGKEYRGHEFHYTQFLGETPKSIVQVYNAKGEPVPTPVFRFKNVFASYTHLYQLTVDS